MRLSCTATEIWRFKYWTHGRGHGKKDGKKERESERKKGREKGRRKGMEGKGRGREMEKGREREREKEGKWGVLQQHNRTRCSYQLHQQSFLGLLKLHLTASYQIYEFHRGRKRRREMGMKREDGKNTD